MFEEVPSEGDQLGKPPCGSYARCRPVCEMTILDQMELMIPEISFPDTGLSML